MANCQGKGQQEINKTRQAHDCRRPGGGFNVTGTQAVLTCDYVLLTSRRVL